MIKDQGLRDYARLLESNGFTIYEPTGTMGTFFTYSRMVGDRECFGTVSANRFQSLGTGYSHSMPIRPSRENGSSMFVAGVPDEVTLTVDAARKVAQPRNRNALVGTQENYKDSAWLERGYVRWHEHSFNDSPHECDVCGLAIAEVAE